MRSTLRIQYLLVALSSCLRHACSYAPLLHLERRRNCFVGMNLSGNDCQHQQSSTSEEDKKVAGMEDIRKMKIKDIKEELAKRKVSTKDAFEKEELVQRLYKARLQKPSTSNSSSTSSPSSSSNNVIQTPLFLTQLDRSIKVAKMYDAVTITPNEQPYATIEIETKGETLRLLLDTACSGFVLRPQLVQRLDLPSLNSPVTMTGAAGSGAATGLTQIDSFIVGGQTFGPLPAALQDIGALPASLDGIIGLSFLNRFSDVELDFEKGLVSFYTKGAPEREDLIARGNLEMIRGLGIYAADVMFGNKGPVKMLVDSGAASTFLGWKGVEMLGLSKSNAAIQPIPQPTGALGSDNVAIQLTHRLHVSSKVNIGTRGYPGLSLAGSRLPVDIGDIPIIKTLEAQGVGGILGIDVMMRARAVRFTFQGQYAMEMYSSAQT